MNIKKGLLLSLVVTSNFISPIFSGKGQLTLPDILSWTTTTNQPHVKITDGDFGEEIAQAAKNSFEEEIVLRVIEDNYVKISTTSDYGKQIISDNYCQLFSTSSIIEQLIKNTLDASCFDITCYENNKQYTQELKSLLIDRLKNKIEKISSPEALYTLSIAQLVFLVQTHDNPTLVKKQLELSRYSSNIFNEFSNEQKDYIDALLNKTA